MPGQIQASTVLQFLRSQNLSKDISTQCHFVLNVKSVCTPKFNHEQNLDV